MTSYRFDLFADYRQSYLQDESTRPGRRLLSRPERRMSAERIPYIRLTLLPVSPLLGGHRRLEIGALTDGSGMRCLTTAAAAIALMACGGGGSTPDARDTAGGAGASAAEAALARWRAYEEAVDSVTRSRRWIFPPRRL